MPSIHLVALVQGHAFHTVMTSAKDDQGSAWNSITKRKQSGQSEREGRRWVGRCDGNRRGGGSKVCGWGSRIEDNKLYSSELD